MIIKTEIRISKEELIDLIKEKYQIDGSFEFIINQRTKMCGDIDVTTTYFDGVIIKN